MLRIDTRWIDTGGRREKVLTLHWERIDIAVLTFWVEETKKETKTDEPLELPLTQQPAAVIERRRAAAEGMPERARPWVFASETSASGHVHNPQHLCAPIALAGGAKFWFTVAKRDPTLPGRRPSGWSIMPSPAT